MTSAKNTNGKKAADKDTGVTEEQAPAGEEETTSSAPADDTASDEAAAADDWAAALAAQADEAGEGEEPAADDWAAALAEQGDEDSSDQGGADAGDSVFKPLTDGQEVDKATPRELDMVKDIPVKLNVVLGRTRITIKQLLELAEGSVVELDGLAGDPLDILVNDYLVAQGEVVVVDDKYGIRITDIITPSERIQRLNR